jgi:NAD(P)H-hydrate epimerase
LDAWPKIKEHLPRISAIAIGPGFSQHPETGKFVHKLIQETDVPLVIDADAINLLAQELDAIHMSGKSPVLTPHPGEMARLIGCSVAEVLDGRPGIVREMAIKGKCYLVLKGYQTLMANPEGDLFLNPTGNSGMASGGMGDVLTGIIAGFLAQGYSKQEAMLLGVYIHGLAGDIAVKEKGEEALLAADLFNTFPDALQMLKKYQF